MQNAAAEESVAAFCIIAAYTNMRLKADLDFRE